MTQINLPDMTIESREPTTDHGLGAPDISAENLAQEIQWATQLNEDAKSTSMWKQTTLDILKASIPISSITDKEISDSVRKVCGHKTWRDVCIFVQEDACSEFFNMALKYCLKTGETHRDNLDFIDGSGIGYLGAFRERLKVTLEQAFDAKYFHKCPRPLEHIRDEFGMDFTQIANFIHPGHWSYPQGHMTKFLTSVEVLDTVFNLSDECFRTLVIAAYVEGQGRCGNLIHYPMDGPASLHFMTPEFKTKVNNL